MKALGLKLKTMKVKGKSETCYIGIKFTLDDESSENAASDNEDYLL